MIKDGNQPVAAPPLFSPRVRQGGPETDRKIRHLRSAADHGLAIYQGLIDRRGGVAVHRFPVSRLTNGRLLFDTVADSISRVSASSSSSARDGRPSLPGMRRANRADVGQNGLELHPLLGRPFAKTDVRDARAERGKPRAS